MNEIVGRILRVKIDCGKDDVIADNIKVFYKGKELTEAVSMIEMALVDGFDNINQETVTLFMNDVLSQNALKSKKISEEQKKEIEKELYGEELEKVKN